jgi:hypothetical protein
MHPNTYTIGVRIMEIFVGLTSGGEKAVCRFSVRVKSATDGGEKAL